jgi:hypothetical protein
MTQPDLPDPVQSAARAAAEMLFAALRPEMSATADPRPEIAALWQTAKLLRAAAGDLDTPGEPAEQQRRERWEEIAGNAAFVADRALAALAGGLDLKQARDWLLDADIREQDVAGTARAYGGTIELTPPDFEDTSRTLTVTVSAGIGRTISVTADRGAAPQPREHTAETLLRTAHHLHRLGEVLGEVALEPGTYGIPMCGSPDRTITCAICEREVGADVARTIEIDKPWQRTLHVCSTTCARAAAAGEHADLD